MKNILVFSLAYHPFVGGAEIAIKEITDRMESDNIRFHIVTMRFDRSWPKEEHIGNAVVHRVGWGRRDAGFARTFSPLFYVSKMLFIPLAAIEGLRLCRREKFDAAWAVMSYMVLPVVLMHMLGARLPYVLTLQEGDSFEHVFGRARLAPVRPLLRYGFRRASAVQAISTYLGAWARKLDYEGPVEVIPNGVDVRTFGTRLEPHERQALRAHLGVTDADTLLFTASRLVRKNGIDTVIRALSLLPKDVHFAIAGEGPERAELATLAAQLEVSHRVHFLGTVPYAKLPRYLHASDIFVRPSRTEGMGNSFIEAMAAGTPVIGTQVGGIADFLFDAARNPDRESTGYAVGADAPDEIVDAVKRIRSNPQESKRVAEHAHDLVARAYDWATIARDMRERVFAQALP